MTYVIGVDSGGTHTTIGVEDPNGKRRGVFEIDKSFSSIRSTIELRRVAHELIAAVRGHTLGQPSAVWINAAGYSVPTRSRLEQILREVADGFDGRIGMCNDGAALLLAHDEEVVVVIAGTGSVVMARDFSGAVVKKGGDEWVASDYGSAFWLGLLGIRAAYQALEGGAETSLLNSLIEHYDPLKSEEGVEPIEDDHVSVSAIARSLASLGSDTKPRIAAFARQVTRQAEQGDDEARSIVRKAVDELASAAARVYRELATRAQPRVVAPRFRVFGGVPYYSKFYFETFRASLDQFLFDARENSGQPIEVIAELNGLAAALALAHRLADGKEFPALDWHHPYSIIEGSGA